MNALEHAVIAAAEIGGARPKTFHAGPDADVMFGPAGGHPYDGLQLTAWVDSFDVAAVAAGRSE